ncbi:MAG: hypothetical protein H0S80_12960, partial [Desulfovibrionaceae bacterium]|nr:hypothetical protein [Desulfovibrionaceae bacterium]
AMGQSAPGTTGWDYTANGVNLDFLAEGETITFSYRVTATDSQGATASDTVTITIHGTNDPPVAIHDGYHEISINPVILYGFSKFEGFNGNQKTELNMSFTALSYDADGNPLPNAQLQTMQGSGNEVLGISNAGPSQTDEVPIDNIGSGGSFPGATDVMRIDFVEYGGHPPKTDPSVPVGQAQVNVDLTFVTPGLVEVIMYDEFGNATSKFVSDDFVLTPADNNGSLIYAIEIMPADPDTSFWLESIYSGPPEKAIDLGSGDNGDGAIEGNVLANDFDFETPWNLTVDDVTNANIGGTPSSGVDGSGNYFLLDGEYGSLKIYENGDYEYTPYSTWENLDTSVTEEFVYTVTDGLDTDTASLEFSFNLNATTVHGDTGSYGNDLIFPADGDAVYSGAGMDTIVIDPVYLGGANGTVNIMDFSDSDRLALGNLVGASVEISSTGSDLNLVFTDVDGSDDIVVNLMGVNPVNPAPVAPVEITNSEDLNTLIQSIIDSGNDHF